MMMQRTANEKVEVEVDPLFPILFGTEQRKFPYHLLFQDTITWLLPVYSLSSYISGKQLREIELQSRSAG